MAVGKRSGKIGRTEGWKTGKREDEITGKLGNALVVSSKEGGWKDGRWEDCLNCDSFDLEITLIVGV